MARVCSSSGGVTRAVEDAPFTELFRVEVEGFVLDASVDVTRGKEEEVEGIISRMWVSVVTG